MTTQTASTSTINEPLGLSTVLLGSLPTTLLTDDAPDRYTVEAVFTRRPDPDEITHILGDETHTFLTERGYTSAVLTVSDRRLDIANTSLEELRDGLGSIIAERLADITAAVKNRRELAAEQLHAATTREDHREVAVSALAESISFHPTRG